MSSRVIITIGRLNFGGVEMRLLRLIKEIRRRDLDIDASIFVVSGKKGLLDDDFRTLDVKLYYGRPGVLGIVELSRLCRALEPDVLWVNAQFAGGFYCSAGWMAGVRHRVSRLATTGRGRNSAFGAAANTLYALFLRTFSNLVVGVSDAARKGSLVPDHKWRTIYDGVDPAPQGLSQPDGYEENRFNIVMLGRGHPVKNVSRGLRLTAALKRSGAAPLLHLVGPRTDQEAADTLTAIAELQIGDSVRLHGPVPDPLAYLAFADVMLLPSFREGLPGVVLEAMSCGLPVVASDLEGVKEIAARCHGVTTLSLESADDLWIEALLRARQCDRARVKAAFEASPFVFSRSFDETIPLWFPEGRVSRRP